MLMWTLGAAAGYCAARVRAAHLLIKQNRNETRERVRIAKLQSKPMRIACVCGHCHDTEQCDQCPCKKHIVLDWEKQQ